uniref:EF-hand domain-containing protein n=1 Tax=Alexandrium catenella TaxID=2925 RepID=A0A7S1MCL0_ALECA|mmetsp:Transcript_23972/g.65339  ORF Transcript_23972/g.65339 Transcript_23972/m.65339 type:complete len:266 (+) Transcript_23972:70-867(+)
MARGRLAQAPQKLRGAQRRIPLALATGFALLVCSPWQRQSFTGGRAAAPRRLATRSGLQAAPSQLELYPDLSRVEDLIYDSCVVLENDLEIECLRTWDKLKKFHEAAEMDCHVDDMRCVVLDVIDRLCQSIDGKDGLILLNKVSGAVLEIRDKFEHWDKAFVAADRDNSGMLTLDDLTHILKEIGSRMSPQEVKSVFLAADINGDGYISREEFADFLTAAIFAEEPLRELQADSLPTKQPDVIDYILWSSAGRTQSWAGLAKTCR